SDQLDVRRERAFLNPGWPPPAPLPSRSPLAAADQADPGYAERARHLQTRSCRTSTTTPSLNAAQLKLIVGPGGACPDLPSVVAELPACCRDWRYVPGVCSDCMAAPAMLLGRHSGIN